MITTAQRNKMKKIFKNGYSKEVLARLNEKGILNRKGEPFGESYINHVFNGRNSNVDIEETIIGLYQEKIDALNQIRSRRKEIFSTKKPEAGTSGDF